MNYEYKYYIKNDETKILRNVIRDDYKYYNWHSDNEIDSLYNNVLEYSCDEYDNEIIDKYDNDNVVESLHNYDKYNNIL